MLAYERRIYPTKEQQVLLNKTFDWKKVIMFKHHFNVFYMGQIDRYIKIMKSQEIK